MRQLQSPLGPSSAPPTPTTPIAPYPGTGKGIPGGLEGTVAPTDMLNVLSAHRESVNTADGKISDSNSRSTYVCVCSMDVAFKMMLYDWIYKNVFNQLLSKI